MLNKQSTIIVAAAPIDFATITFLSNAAFSKDLCIIPIHCVQEYMDALKSEESCLIVYDRNYKLDITQIKNFQRAIGLGARWCSLKVYLSHVRGFAEIENMSDLLEWLELENYKSETVFIERMKSMVTQFAAVLLLIPLSPLFIAIALGIKLTNPGPIIYSQTRVGHRGKTFQLFKFRSMYVDAECNGPQWSSGDRDPRTFPFGKFLRKSHLDELPQLWNVIKGDLTFIGPRPERPEYHTILVDEIPHFESRTRVKPGITGWAQLISGYASSVEDCKKKIAHDLFFIRNSHRSLHLTIILKTIQKVLSEITISSFKDFLRVKSK
ncbi:MAG: hypothetical protein RJB13_1272 [Pseudomonadota bacterium]